MIKSFWQKAWPHVTVILIFVVVAAIYCKPALEGKVLQQSDIIHWKGVAQQSFEYKEKYGHFPLWTNSMFSGMPAYQIAMQRTSAISLDYFQPLFTLGLPKPISFFFLACLMFYLLCQALRINPWISAGCAIAYAYSTFDPVIIAVGHDSQMLSIAYAPGVLAGLFMLYDKKYWSGTALTIIFSGLLIAQSHQQIVYYTLLIIGAIGIAYAVKCFREKQLKHFVIANALALFAIGAGFASNAMMYLTTYEFAKESIRGGKSELTTNPDGTKKTQGGLDIDYAFNWSYGKAETFTFIVPALYGGGGSREITGSSKFVEKMTEVGIPEENALQYANGNSYWGPQPGTSGPVYLGAIICCLFIAGMFFIKSWHKGWIAGIVVFAIMLSWGKNFAGFNDFMFNHFPFYNKFRAPTMALVIPQLVFPLMAALALQQVLFENVSKELRWKKFKLSAYVTGGLIVLMAIFYFMSDFKGARDSQVRDDFTNSMLQQAGKGQQPTPEMQQQATQFGQSLIRALETDRKGIMMSDLLRSTLFIAFALALLGLYIKDKLKAPVVLACILLLSSYDVLAVGKRYLNDENFIEASDYEGNFSLTAADNTIKADPDKYFRVFDQTTRDPFSDAKASYYHNSLGGYLAARLGLYQDLMDNQLRKGNKAVFNMLNTKYIIQQNPANGQSVAVPNPEAFGPCWLVKDIHYVKDGNEEMKALDSINLRDNAIVQDKYKNLIPAAPAYDSTASIKLDRNVNDTIVYSSSAKTNQFAVFSEIYYDKGWNVSIDGKKADYLRVDYALRGLSLPAGNHNIEFRFEPRSYKLGNTLAIIASLLAYILLLAAGWQQWKKIKAEK